MEIQQQQFWDVDGDQKDDATRSNVHSYQIAQSKGFILAFWTEQCREKDLY